MAGLKETLYQKILAWRPRIKMLIDEHGDVVVDTVTIGKLLGGMRDLNCLVTDISYLDPNEGIRYRALGYPLERPKSVTTDMLEQIARGEITGEG